jgi:hypothetical protein
MAERVLNGARAVLLALALIVAAAVVSVAWWAQPALAVDGDTAGRFESCLASETGTWGDNLTWSYDEATRTLTISGEGAMAGGSNGDSGLKTHVGSVSPEHVVISEGVTSIGSCAFYNCTSLASVTIPEGVTSIRSSAFCNCTSLASVAIPSSVITIALGAFDGCTSLASVFIPEGVTSIGDAAFYGCTSLASVAIPASVTSIDSLAFSGCTSLASFSVASGNASYQTVTGREIVSASGELVAYADGSGESYSIPASVTSICSLVFSGCTSLASVAIPASVTSIGSSAFSYCTSLADVYYAGTESDRSCISVGGDNSCLTGATWHYNYVPAPIEPSGEGVEGFVERLYENVMGRTADDEGKAVQVQGMKTSGAAQITFNFYNSEEFKAKAATMTNAEIVENVYQTMLGRSADKAGLAMWKSYLDNGMSACALAAGFAESQEFANVCAGYGIGTGSADWLRANSLESRDKVPGVTSFVYRLYTIVLDRAAEVAGLNVQCQALIDGTACWDMATRFFDSQEYKNFAKTDTDFVADCYKAMMDREGSESEIAAWTARMDKENLSRVDVVKGFCQSDEFEAICQSCGMTSGMR